MIRCAEIALMFRFARAPRLVVSVATPAWTVLTVIFVRAFQSASVESVVMMDAVVAVVLVPPRLALRLGCANVIYVPFKIASVEMMAAATLAVVELVGSAVVWPISLVSALQIALEKRAVVMVVAVAAVVAYRLKFVPRARAYSPRAFPAALPVCVEMTMVVVMCALAQSVSA